MKGKILIKCFCKNDQETITIDYVFMQLTCISANKNMMYTNKTEKGKNIKINYILKIFLVVVCMFVAASSIYSTEASFITGSSHNSFNFCAIFVCHYLCVRKEKHSFVILHYDEGETHLNTKAS